MVGGTLMQRGVPIHERGVPTQAEQVVPAETHGTKLRFSGGA